MRTITDSEPFDASPASFPLGLMDGYEAKQRAHADARREMRLRAEKWGVARGFEVKDSGLMRVSESVEVAIRFDATTAEMCTLHANALQPTELHVQVEPKSWTDWVVARLASPFETADRAFDEHWHVKTDSAPVAKRLLDARVRTALTNHPIWCSVTYTNGRIDLHLDSGTERLTGTHLLAATELAIALSRATPHLPSTPYR